MYLIQDTAALSINYPKTSSEVLGIKITPFKKLVTRGLTKSVNIFKQRENLEGQYTDKSVRGKALAKQWQGKLHYTGYNCAVLPEISVEKNYELMQPFPHEETFRTIRKVNFVIAHKKFQFVRWGSRVKATSISLAFRTNSKSFLW